MLDRAERDAIARLWERKVRQDALDLPFKDRHRNLEPASAEAICALATGVGAQRVLEIGGSSGLSTIALASAVRATGGRLISLEIEPQRQAEARGTLESLGLDSYADLILADAATVIPSLGAMDFVLIDCEKEDYIRFFDMLSIAADGIVVADNVISHSLTAYVAHVRAQPGLESITLPVGKGLEVTRFPVGKRLAA